ncbi:hypothetical protein EV401DRAFT_2064275 [Pisolithus croceorrhizus]|nr:hypothetical protein EV401DRAFT_2064275 [Pisolithus croceorrhizus]
MSDTVLFTSKISIENPSPSDCQLDSASLLYLRVTTPPESHRYIRLAEEMSKSEREDVISHLADRIFSAMLDELTMDAALRGHREIARNSCGMAHARNGHQQPQRASNDDPPVFDGKTVSSTGTSTPTGSKEGIVLFECPVCKRQIASNRYAPHLSGCMGIGTGSRRGAARGTLKTKLPIETIRSDSPLQGSENGNFSDDNSGGKGSYSHFREDDDEFNLKRKQPVSPQTSPAKKPKKQKTAGSVASRLKDSTVTGSQSKIPSKLRSSSTASFLDRDRSATPASQSSSGTPIATSVSSVISGQSPAGTGPPKRGRPKGSKTGMGRGAAVIATQVKRPSPPRPPPPPQPDYLIDVEGDETGSSTDTD